MKSLFNFSRALAVAKKEVMHILRDPFTIGLALGLPIVFVIFFGFSIDFDFKGIRLSVFDFDNSRQSRDLIQTFSSSGYFKVMPGKNLGDPVREVESEKALIAMVIKPGFGKDILSGSGAKVQMLLDGTDNNKTGVVIGYMAGMYNAVAGKLTGMSVHPALSFSTRFVYNPELNTRWFIVPGLIVVIIGLLSILLTALTIAREWENGSMELLLSTPVTPLEIVVGKITPYVFLVFLGISIVYIIARIVFGVPFLGSNLLFWAACVIYILTCLAQGIFISAITRQQQKAMQFSFVLGLLPSLILSGFIFPVENMAVFFRYLSAILPPRWFMEIIRSIFLKGSNLIDLALPFGILVLMSVFFIVLAAKKSKKDVEP